MKKLKTLVVSLLLSTNFLALAQNTKIDSLKNELSIYKKEDSVKVNLYNELISEIYANSNLDSATVFIEKAKVIAQQNNFNFGLAKSIYFEGRIAGKKHNYTASITYFNKALSYFKALDKKKEIADCYSGIGRAYYFLSNSEKAIEYCKKNLAINKEINYTPGISRALNNLGALNTSAGNYEDALIYFEKSLEYRTKDNFLKGMASTSSNIGSIYSRLGNYPKSLEYFQKSLKIFTEINENHQIINTINNIGTIYQNQEKPYEALEYYKRGLAISKSENIKDRISQSLSHIGTVYSDLSEHDKALVYFEEALQINKEINIKWQIATTLINIANSQLALGKNVAAIENNTKALDLSTAIKRELLIHNSNIGLAKAYEKQKKYDKALYYALQGEKIAEKLNSVVKLKDSKEILFKIYKNTKNYKKAFESHQQFKVFNDSIFNKKNVEKLAQLKYEYKYKQALDSASIRELKLNKTVLLTSRDLEKSQQNLLLGIIVFLGIALLLGFIIFFLKLRNIKAKTKNIIVEQKLLRSQMTPHFIFNSLSVIQGMILNNENENSIAYLSKFSKLLRTILENSRYKTVSLSDELLAIESYVALQNIAVHPPYNYCSEISSAIDQKKIKIPPMIIQPFIENAIEHAFTNKKEDKKIDLKITFVDKRLVCTITDNGNGIVMEAQKKQQLKNSLATTITSKRIAMLSKDFKIDGSLTLENRAQFGEQGTVVTIVIPYKIDSL